MTTYPKRIERGLCPGLEAAMLDTAGGLEGLVASHHEGARHDGDWQDCNHGFCAPVRLYADKLREALYEWTGAGS